MYRVLIVEDIASSLDLLKMYVQSREELILAGIALDGKEALKKLISEEYDLLLIDIDLPYLNGIEVLNELNKKKEGNIYTIFTTAYDQYAIDAFTIGAVDYLLKPFTLERFNLAIDRFLLRIAGDSNTAFFKRRDSLYYKTKRKLRIIPFNDILYLSSCGKNTLIHAKNDSFQATGLIKEFERKLPENIFLRIHKQYIANINYAKGFEYDHGSHSQYLLLLNDDEDTVLPVGKDYISILKNLLFKGS